MAIVKLTKSKRGVLFVDEEGNVFCVSSSMLARMLGGELIHPVVLTRFANKVNPSRFKPSPVFGVPVDSVDNLTNANDAFSRAAASNKALEKSVDDSFSEW